MGEMVSYLPIDGSYLQFALRFVDESFGFAMGWMLVSPAFSLCLGQDSSQFYNYAMIVAAEAVAVASLVNYWNDTISNGVWCSLFVVSCVAVVSTISSGKISS
jgi:amino acid permease